MKREIHPIVLFISKISMFILAALLVGYIYAILIARTEFSKSIFIALMTLGVIALGLTIKGIIYDLKSKRAEPNKNHETNS